MIILVKGRQRTGKTTVVIGIGLYLVLECGYSTSDIVSNIRLYHEDGTELKEYYYLTNKQMKLYVKIMVEKGLKHKIIIIDEIDRVFSHRFWSNKEQAEALLGLWQDEKLFNWIIGTAHLGRSVDNLIRESCQIEIIAEIDKPANVVDLTILNALDLNVYEDVMYNARLVQSLFKSWDPVV